MRECYCCGSIKTYVRKSNKGISYESWYTNGIDNQWLCMKCYNRYITAPFWDPIKNPIKNKRRLTSNGKVTLLKEDPRIGVCNWCRAVKDIDCKITHMHHDEYNYDINNPLRFTIEICARCHSNETYRLGK